LLGGSPPQEKRSLNFQEKRQGLRDLSRVRTENITKLFVQPSLII